MNISRDQLAELLVGIAKSQAAMARALPEATVGLAIVPALQVASGINKHRAPTLQDLPQRILLHIVTGNEGPALETAKRELLRLLP